MEDAPPTLTWDCSRATAELKQRDNNTLRTLLKVKARVKRDKDVRPSDTYFYLFLNRVDSYCLWSHVGTFPFICVLVKLHGMSIQSAKLVLLIRFCVARWFLWPRTLAEIGAKEMVDANRANHRRKKVFHGSTSEIANEIMFVQRSSKTKTTQKATLTMCLVQ